MNLQGITLSYVDMLRARHMERPALHCKGQMPLSCKHLLWQLKQLICSGIFGSACKVINRAQTSHQKQMCCLGITPLLPGLVLHALVGRQKAMFLK